MFSRNVWIRAQPANKRDDKMKREKNQWKGNQGRERGLLQRRVRGWSERKGTILMLSHSTLHCPLITESIPRCPSARSSVCLLFMGVRPIACPHLRQRFQRQTAVIREKSVRRWNTEGRALPTLVVFTGGFQAINLFSVNTTNEDKHAGWPSCLGSFHCLFCGQILKMESLLPVYIFSWSWQLCKKNSASISWEIFSSSFRESPDLLLSLIWFKIYNLPVLIRSGTTQKTNAETPFDYHIHICHILHIFQSIFFIPNSRDAVLRGWLSRKLYSSPGKQHI